MTYRNILNSQLDLSERLLLVVVKIGKGELNNSSLERVVGVFKNLGSVDQGLSGILVLEESRGLDIVPLCSLNVHEVTRGVKVSSWRLRKKM